MVPKKEMLRLLAYTEWANHLFLEAVAALSPEDYARDLRGSHRGVRGTLLHTFGAEHLWLQRYRGLPHSDLPTEETLPDLASLRQRWAAHEAERREWLAGLPEDAGERIIDYRNLKGEPFSAPLGPLVQHLANHGSYHRGQVAVFLRQLGLKPPTTDLVAFDREQAAKSA